MKRKIKIRRKLLKEAGDPTWPPKNPKAEETWRKGPKAEPTLSPIGKSGGTPREKTIQFPGPSGAVAFQGARKNIDVAQELPSSSDPTAKESPEDIKRALSKVIKEPGLLEKVFGWVQSKFLSQPSLEVPEIEAEEEMVEPAREPDLSKAINYAEKYGISNLGAPPESEVGFGDPMEDPEREEEIDFDEKFRPLQEIARRHFKKG